MHFNGFPFAIHKELVLQLSDLEKLRCSLFVPLVCIRTQFLKRIKKISSLGGLYVSVFLFFKMWDRI